MRRLAELALCLLALAACGDRVGETCELRSGALGFGFDDDCASKCLQLEDVTCPDGSTVRKAVCAGAEGCRPGSCEEGQICYAFEDPFDEEFYCIPADYCGPGLSAEKAAAWEAESWERSDALRTEFAERAKARSAKPTAPAAAEPVPE